MAYTLNTDIQSLAGRLTQGLEAGLEAAIKDKLMAQADVIVSKLAREMAQNLRGSIKMWQDVRDDRVQIALIIDGVADLVPPLPTAPHPKVVPPDLQP